MEKDVVEKVEKTIPAYVPEGPLGELFSVGAHFAYAKSRRHPSARPFIFGAKNRTEIFDLEKTLIALETAKTFMRKLGKERAMVLLIGGKEEAKQAIREGASSISMPFVAGRWIGGTFTNFSQIRKRVMTLEDLTAKRERGELAKYTKKERLLIDRDIARLTMNFSGLIPMKQLPKAIFVIDSKKEDIPVTEAIQMNIPILALSNSDCDLHKVTLAIPANDASAASIAYFVRELVKAYEEGTKEAPVVTTAAPVATPVVEVK